MEGIKPDSTSRDIGRLLMVRTTRLTADCERVRGLTERVDSSNLRPLFS
jgi:hypothetical protein